MYYVARGWSGCSGSAWGTLSPGTKDGWRHAEHLEGVARQAIESVGIGGHGHWREGGAGGKCSSCDAAHAERARLSALLTSVIPPEMGDQP